MQVIQTLGPEKETVEVVGTRISKALAKSRTSWVLGYLGALYWRVKGDAPNAINCLRMALMNVPADSRVCISYMCLYVYVICVLNIVY